MCITNGGNMFQKTKTVDTITSGLRQIVEDLDDFMDLESAKALTEEKMAGEMLAKAQSRILEVERAHNIKIKINSVFK